MKLVVCLDGTWNEASTRTNVWKLKQDIDCSADTDTQATYIEGIGTVTGDEWVSGIFAVDFDRPLGLAYRWLTKKILNAPDGEDIKVYLFGFSRGGYLAHTLSWLLSEVGIPRRFASAIPIAKAYANKDFGMIERLKKDGVIPSPQIVMLGLWDAVTSPHDMYRGYHDSERAANVSWIYHAMATDERREWYGAMQYDRGAKIVQRWFTGVHKDVGGGYPANECELSDVTLDWMKRCAVKCGLGFKTPLAERPRSYDFSSLTKIHNEEEVYDPIKERAFHQGQLFDRSVRDRVKTDKGYFPVITDVPAKLIDWLKGRIASAKPMRRMRRRRAGSDEDSFS